MRLYVWNKAPNPRRVAMYLAEKGLAIPTEDVGLEGKGELQPAFLTERSQRLVPLLVLDDGTEIGEAAAICRYLEALHPEPPLWGRDARESALVDMWERRAELEGLHAVGEALRNRSAAFEGRGLAGYDVAIPRIEGLVERGRVRVAAFLRKLDARLSESPFVASDVFTMADITTFCAVSFVPAAKMAIGEDQAHLRRWYDTIAARPSARAGM